MVFKKLRNSIIIAVVLSATFIPLTTYAVERYEVMQYGDKDKYVERLQKELYARGYMKSEPTGYFGKETQQAVAKYQDRHELESDGKAGPKTQQAILGKNYQPIPKTREVKEDKSSKDESSSSSGVTHAKKYKDPESIGNGDEGSSVTKIQKRLKELGYYTYRKTTTYYGDITEEAVAKFQKQNGLSDDGVVGKRTSKLLYSSKAEKYSKKKDKASSSSSSGKKKSTAAEKSEETSKSQTSKGRTKAERAINLANSLIGKRYRTGATGPNTFDCSGFIYYCLKAQGMSSPRTSNAMSRYSSWPKVDRDNMRAGDLIFFTSPNSGGSVGHVGMYLGGGKFIHSSSGRAKGVTISSLSGSYSSRYKWARRPFK